MAEKSTGLRRALQSARFYSFFQAILSKKTIWPDLIAQYLDSAISCPKVLDIGCGPGTFLAGEFLAVNPRDFVGVDPSSEYIRSARERFPLATFHEGTVSQVKLEDKVFDLVVLSGVLHHVNDAEAHEIIEFAIHHLARGGVVISLDVVVFPGQNWFARAMALADRGQNVRTVEDMERLWGVAKSGISKFLTDVTYGYLRVPYNHVVCVARK